MTLTMRHRANQPLAELWAAAQRGWYRATGGKGWVLDGRRVEGWVRVWEVTWGRNGWHVHVHCVLVLGAEATADDVERLGEGMFRRWSGGLVSAGLEAPRRVGQDWHLVGGGDGAASALGDYLAKFAGVADPSPALGLELTHSAPGRSRSGLRTVPVWQLLSELVESGEAKTLRAWHEWEAVSKGKRQVGWSKGLRERFAPAVVELTDDEIVSRELGQASDDVVRWSSEQWREFCGRPDRMVRLLEVAERLGVAGVVAQLDEWGCPYELVSKGERQ